jgi:5-methylcytosine-specific restriction endonuclease McrA
MLEELYRWLVRRVYGDPECEFRGLRSSQWLTVRKHHLRLEDRCQWCGAKRILEVHHVIPFHICPEKELDQTNLITLCAGLFRNCHFKRGHLRSWRSYDPAIRQECEEKKQL